MKEPKSLDTFTHEDLRKVAVRWLTSYVRCTVVLSEMHTTSTQEIPDAVGFRGTHSHCVEVKSSRPDYFRNKEKSHVRIESLGVGVSRYMMVRRGLISVDEHIQAYPSYGLLWVHEHGIVKSKHEGRPHEHNQSAEVGMLVSALRRIKTREFITIATVDGNSDLGVA